MAWTGDQHPALLHDTVTALMMTKRIIPNDDAHPHHSRAKSCVLSKKPNSQVYAYTEFLRCLLYSYYYSVRSVSFPSFVKLIMNVDYSIV